MWCPVWGPATETLVEKLVKSIKICSSINSIVPNVNCLVMINMIKLWKMLTLGGTVGSEYGNAIMFVTVL